MNREIKFRAWSKNQEFMFPWKDIFLGGSETTLKEVFGSLKESGFVFMQFTGLLDKNGKEIFEGDIVKHPNGKLQEVEFMSFIHWSMEFGETETSSSEVMGNVFENPDLLSSNNRSRE